MAGVSSETFGQTQSGETVTRYTLKNSKGVSVSILNYGGIIVDINVPDRDGNFDDISLGFDNVPDYETKSPYFGAICGRVANVVAGAQFDLEGQTYKLYENRPPLSVHGGKAGFDKKTWQAEVVGDNKLSLTYVSPHLEENYPGELTSSVTYSLDDHSALTLQYAATTTRTTVLNLTNHAYFNLAGHGHGHLNDHRLKVFSDKYLVLDDIYVPTG
ncbi:LOW QUALITY PROTEIN: galactose mutarotase-like [Aplysia californica]|uniref:Galactose mutarotase n=1 Tax=Aplysia californica TaxID=6500 RepID=A0ABM1W267_APLCA|nr:LOW QUALITY PROTEIN: galactose mutarotase-like [Aplysia californica]